MHLQVTALEIAALKRVSKNSSVLVMDRNGGGPAKGVAKELQRLGFRKVYIVTGGFSGWNTSKLQVRAPVGKVRPFCAVLVLLLLSLLSAHDMSGWQRWS